MSDVDDLVNMLKDLGERRKRENASAFLDALRPQRKGWSGSVVDGRVIFQTPNVDYRISGETAASLSRLLMRLAIETHE